MMSAEAAESDKLATTYRFVKYSAFAKFNKFPRCQDLPADAFVDIRARDVGTVELSMGSWSMRPPCFFVSHRWIRADHPDPESLQLLQLKERLDALRLPEAFIFYDYCSMYQKPRSDVEEHLFRSQLYSLNFVTAKCDFWWLGTPDYFERAWCVFEFGTGALVRPEIYGVSTMEKLVNIFLQLNPEQQKLSLKEWRRRYFEHITKELEASQLTNAGDREAILRLFKEFSAIPSKRSVKITEVIVRIIVKAEYKQPSFSQMSHIVKRFSPTVFDDPIFDDDFKEEN